MSVIASISRFTRATNHQAATGIPSPVGRPSAGVFVSLAVLGSVLLAVVLRLLVVRAMLRLLRADGLHRVGRGADLAGFDNRSERGRCAFAGRGNPCAFDQQIGKSIGLMRRQPDDATVLEHGPAGLALRSVNRSLDDALRAHR